MTAPPDCEPLWHADEADWDLAPPDPRLHDLRGQGLGAERLHNISDVPIIGSYLMNPDQELTAAADKLRSLATTASTIRSGQPTARWHFKQQARRHTGYLYAENPDGTGVRITAGDDSMRTGHGEYAAAMDPTVGLVLAAVFEAWARMGDLDPDLLNRVGGPETLAVARAINTGGQP